MLTVSYVQISSDSCETRNMAMIQTKQECEQAALSLGLSDTTASPIQTNGLPYGCIYSSNGWLNWYSPDGSPHESASCGSQADPDDCICKVALSKNNFGGHVIFFIIETNLIDIFFIFYI